MGSVCQCRNLCTIPYHTHCKLIHFSAHSPCWGCGNVWHDWKFGPSQQQALQNGVPFSSRGITISINHIEYRKSNYAHKRLFNVEEYSTRICIFPPRPIRPESDSHGWLWAWVPEPAGCMAVSNPCAVCVARPRSSSLVVTICTKQCE